MTKSTIIFWRDIPSQVVVKQGRTSAKAQLSKRFMEAIDKAAMRAGRQGSKEYLEDWRRVIDTCTVIKSVTHINDSIDIITYQIREKNVIIKLQKEVMK